MKAERMIPLEKNVQKAILKFLNSLPQCRARNVSGNPGGAGEPDIDACLQGVCIKIEVKRPGNNRLTALQSAVLAEWQNAGAIAGMVHSVEETKKLIASHRPDLVAW